MSQSDKKPTAESVDRMLEAAREAGPGTDASRALNELLRESAEARRIAAELLSDESAMVEELRTENAAGYFEPSAIFPKKQAESTGRGSRISWIGIAAVFVGLMAITAAIVMSDRSAPKDNIARIQESVSTEVIARIEASHQAEFSGELLPQNGELSSGRYVLESGSVALTLENNVQLTLVGPVDIDLHDLMRVQLHRGRLRAEVPENARGFRVDTPGPELTDLGTEFGVFVDESEATELHVFQGEVEFQEADQESIVATEGFAARWRGADRVAMDVPDLAAFPRSEQVEIKRWQDYSQSLRRDPSAVFYYDFEKDPTDSQRLRDRSSASPLDAMIEGCNWVSGRWSGKGALLFENSGDTGKLDIPGEFQAVTLMAWIKPNRFEHTLQVIMNTEGWEPGEHHWQVLRSGAIRAGIKLDGTVVSAEKTVPRNRWIHLAAVLDREEGIARYYADGEEVALCPLTSEIPLQFGPCTIGAWTGINSNEWPHNREFRGRMDELAMFSRAFSAEEIVSAYNAGRPSQSD